MSVCKKRWKSLSVNRVAFVVAFFTLSHARDAKKSVGVLQLRNEIVSFCDSTSCRITFSVRYLK